MTESWTYTSSSRNKSKKPLGLAAWFLKKQRVGYDPKAFWCQTKLEPNIRNNQSYPQNCWSYLNKTLASLGIEIFTLWSTNLTPITPEDSSFESGPNVVKLVPEPNKAGHGGVGLLAVSSKMNPSTQNTKEWRKNYVMHFSLNGILSRLPDNREIHIWWKSRGRTTCNNHISWIIMSKSSLAIGRWEWQLAARVLIIRSKLTSLCLYSTIFYLYYTNLRDVGFGVETYVFELGPQALLK